MDISLDAAGLSPEVHIVSSACYLYFLFNLVEAGFISTSSIWCYFVKICKGQCLLKQFQLLENLVVLFSPLKFFKQQSDLFIRISLL